MLDNRTTMLTNLNECKTKLKTVKRHIKTGMQPSQKCTAVLLLRHEELFILWDICYFTSSSSLPSCSCVHASIWDDNLQRRQGQHLKHENRSFITARPKEVTQAPEKPHTFQLHVDRHKKNSQSVQCIKLQVGLFHFPLTAGILAVNGCAGFRARTALDSTAPHVTNFKFTHSAN